jgi:hypothetical protein
MEVMIMNPHCGMPSFFKLTSEQMVLLGLKSTKLLTITIYDEQVKRYQDVFREFLERLLYDDERIKKYLACCTSLYELNHILEMIEAQGDIADLVSSAWAFKRKEIYAIVKERFS